MSYSFTTTTGANCSTISVIEYCGFQADSPVYRQHYSKRFLLHCWLVWRWHRLFLRWGR